MPNGRTPLEAMQYALLQRQYDPYYQAKARQWQLAPIMEQLALARERRQAEAASKLQNYLAMTQYYPQLAATPEIQQAWQELAGRPTWFGLGRATGAPALPTTITPAWRQQIEAQMEMYRRLGDWMTKLREEKPEVYRSLFGKGTDLSKLFSGYMDIEKHMRERRRELRDSPPQIIDPKTKRPRNMTSEEIEKMLEKERTDLEKLLFISMGVTGVPETQLGKYLTEPTIEPTKPTPELTKPEKLREILKEEETKPTSLERFYQRKIKPKEEKFAARYKYRRPPTPAFAPFPYTGAPIYAGLPPITGLPPIEQRAQELDNAGFSAPEIKKILVNEYGLTAYRKYLGVK